MATKTMDKVASKSQSKAEPITYDLLLVGGSPSNLTMAHRLCDLAKANPEQKISVAILEKAEEFGSHIVSGAVVNKAIFDKAYPNHIADGMPIEAICDESHFSILSENAKWDVPSVVTRAALPDFVKEGYYVLTLSAVVEWMAQTLEAKAKDIPNITVDLFPGFAAQEALIENNKVIGVRVGKSGEPNEDNVYASLVAFGDKGFLSKDVIKHFGLEANPQLWSVGVKETWKLAEGAPSMKGKVYHTLGYPTQDGTLGGGFVYGLDHNRLTIGLVISLDSKNPNIHPQKQLQEYKKHPWLQKLLRGAELMNYGAAVLPEGGIASLPKAFQVDGAMMLGDALGLLDMKSLAGVDKAIESGYLAAQTAFKAVTGKDLSAQNLHKYQDDLMHSPFMDKFKANRYFRKAFLDNPELLNQYLPKFLSGIELSETPVVGGLLGPLVGGLNVALSSNPFKALAQTIDAAVKMNLADDVKQAIVYKPGYQAIDPNFSKELIKRNQGKQDFNKSTIYSREDAVFYAQTKYLEHPEHIDEFSSDTCLKCINKYEAVKLDVPCVSDCTAEVHRLDITDEVKVHAMSLENCVQCRTCELVCPEQNLRVNPAYAGAGPDFRGL